MRTWWLVGGVSVALTVAASANLVWQEDFTDVSDWSVIFNNLGGTAQLTSDGTLGHFFVGAGNNEVAYGPIGAQSGYVPFVPASSSDYTLSFIVDSLTGSTSYDIRLDEFGSTSNYLGTVFAVFPQGTFAGSTNVNLGAFSYDPSTTYVLPKVTVFTGSGEQEVVFDNLQFDQIPEPMTASLLAAGVALLAIRSRRSQAH